MSLLTKAAWLVAIALMFSGCSRQPEHTQLPPSPADLMVARKAISLRDVSLMVRSGYKEQAIMAEITGRRVSETLDAPTESALRRSAASPALIEVLKTDANVLTQSEKEAYDYLAAQRANRSEQERAAAEKELPAQPPASNDVVQRTVQNLRNADAYKAEKESLETRIVSQEAYIGRLRANGYNESQLVEHNEKLNRYQEQLRTLKQPLP